MIDIKENRKELPLEVGKTYKTKFATGENFTVTILDTKKDGSVNTAWGVYEKSPHLGNCPLSPEQLIKETTNDGWIVDVRVSSVIRKSASAEGFYGQVIGEPGAVSQGASIEETAVNLVDAFMALRCAGGKS